MGWVVALTIRWIHCRWPFSLLTGGRPIDIISQELKTAVLSAGIAVVSMDVRGTGV